MLILILCCKRIAHQPSLHSRTVRELLLALSSVPEDSQERSLGHLTTSALQLIKAIQSLYKRAFVKAVYTALRDGAPVHPHDILKVDHFVAQRCKMEKISEFYLALCRAYQHAASTRCPLISRIISAF